MTYLDVIIPGPWWNSLTYIFDGDDIPPYGARVRVPVKNSPRVGFVSGVSKNGECAKDIKYKNVAEVLDNNSALGEELWDLALWAGHYFMCGAGEVIKVMSPPQLLKGEPLRVGKPLHENKSVSDKIVNRKFCESECYLPYDSERGDFYLNRLMELEGDDAALVLFPELSSAKRFYNLLPQKLNDRALLWGAKGTAGFWRNWQDIRNGNINIVVGAPSAVYAPLCGISLIIVEDEANSAYVSARYPNLPARSIAGKRALLAGAELILGGRLPSAKTCFRKKVKCNFLPEKDLLHFVDIKDGFRATVQGVENPLPISRTLVSETKKCLNEKKTALWIFDRKGYAIEVLCENCGQGLFCPLCGGVMTAENETPEGEIVTYCRRCANRVPLPESCPSCRGNYFVGRKPGLEALKSIAGAFCEREGVIKSAEKKLVVGTRKILSLCDSVNVGLIAWIDIDLEANKTDYASRFQAFSMVWESLWRGAGRAGASDKANKNANRRIVVQSRSPAKGWQIGLKSGWEYFWDKELAERTELEFPPYKPLIEIEVSAKENERLAKLLEENGHMVMSSPESEGGKNYIWLSASSLSALEKTLSPRFSINKSRYGYPRVRIFVE
ncbi:MAG: hypothetical protein FWG09_05750 [Synergistaceae bacterium]|nr:hypothetical protein [Synergistaceae bacterium]